MFELIDEVHQAKATDQRIECPPEINTPELQAIWYQVIGCYSADYFNLGDVPLIIGYCRLKVKADDNYRLLEEEGELITTAQGMIQKNPRWNVWKEATTAQATLATKLRITTSARTPTEKAQHSSRKAKADKVFVPGSDWRDHQRLDA